MKKCPSCNRVYSDTVTQCPTCGIELSKNAASGTGNGSWNQETGKVQTHDQKVVNSGTEKKKNNAGRWKTASAVLLIVAILFAGLYATQASEYDALEKKYSRKNLEYNSLSEEFNSLNKEHEELERVFAFYDLEGKYAIELTSVYNGDSNEKEISKDLTAKSLKYVFMKWTVHSFSEEWDDIIYINVIRPDGSVMTPQSKYNNFTTQDDLRDRTGSSQERIWHWADQSWKKGTYQVVFVQAESVIASFAVEVT